MIKLDRDFWELRTIFFGEDVQGEFVCVVNKETGEIDSYYVDDKIEEGVMKDMERKNRLLKNIKENPSRYLVITAKGRTIYEQIEVMKKHGLVPKDRFPSDEEIEEYKKHVRRF